MIKCIAEKYKLNEDEVIKSVHEDVRFQEMIVHPTIKTMQYFKEDEVPKAVEESRKRARPSSEVEEVLKQVDELVEGVSEMKVTEPKKAPQKRVIRRAPKADS